MKKEKNKEENFKEVKHIKTTKNTMKKKNNMAVSILLYLTSSRKFISLVKRSTNHSLPSFAF